MYLNKPNLIILHGVIFFLRDWIEIIKKKGFFKRLEYIKDKNEELLNVFSAANKISGINQLYNEYFDTYKKNTRVKM